VPATKELVWVEAAGQTHFYDTPDLVASCAQQLAAWFLRYL
jgi:hypothetical protein